MTGSLRVLGPAAALAAAAGAALAWKPVLVLLLGLATVVVWSVATPERLNYLLFGLLFLVPATADPGYPTSPAWTILLAATAVALYGRLQRLDPRRPLTSPGMVTFALPVAAALAALACGTGARPLLAGLLPLVAYAVIGWHAVEEARLAPQGWQSLARTFAWVGVPLSLLSIYQRATGTRPLLDTWAISNAFTASADPTRSVGLMGHPIVYGTYCMAMMCIAIALRGRWWPAPFAAGAVGLLLSGSRSAWIGTAAALAVWWFAQRLRVTRRGLALAAAGGALAVLLAWLGPAPIRNTIGVALGRLTNLTGSASATARYERTSQAWSGIRDSVGTVLFGYGPEAHVRFFREVGIDDGLAQTFDNSYLTLWYDFGVLVVICLVGLFVVAWLRLRAVVTRMFLVAFAVQIWFFDFYLWPCTAATLILVVGLGYAELGGAHARTCATMTPGSAPASRMPDEGGQ